MDVHFQLMLSQVLPISWLCWFQHEVFGLLCIKLRRGHSGRAVGGGLGARTLQWHTSPHLAVHGRGLSPVVTATCGEAGTQGRAWFGDWLGASAIFGLIVFDLPSPPLLPEN